jgi:hypothetical protein
VKLDVAAVLARRRVAYVIRFVLLLDAKQKGFRIVSSALYTKLLDNMANPNDENGFQQLSEHEQQAMVIVNAVTGAMSATLALLGEKMGLFKVRLYLLRPMYIVNRKRGCYSVSLRHQEATLLLSLKPLYVI